MLREDVRTYCRAVTWDVQRPLRRSWPWQLTIPKCTKEQLARMTSSRYTSLVILVSTLQASSDCVCVSREYVRVLQPIIRNWTWKQTFKLLSSTCKVETCSKITSAKWSVTCRNRWLYRKFTQRFSMMHGFHWSRTSQFSFDRCWTTRMLQVLRVSSDSGTWAPSAQNPFSRSPTLCVHWLRLSYNVNNVYIPAVPDRLTSTVKPDYNAGQPVRAST